MKRSRVLFLYDHFYPDFTAGGPITALGNLSKLVDKGLDFSIITSAYEYKSKRRLTSVSPNQWSTWHKVPVFYSSSAWNTLKAVASFDKDYQTTVYLNGVFSWDYFLLPLLFAWFRNYRIIVSPRGMLQSGALKTHPFKKTMYLSILKLMGFLSHALWHATDDQEAEDVRRIFGKRVAVSTIPDVPIIVAQPSATLFKQPGEFRAVYFSLIAEKKNLLYLLHLLEDPAFSRITLDIIGPVKDQDYWEKCLRAMQGDVLRNRVVYKGEVPPDRIGEVLPQYHGMLLSTFGENFGHVIIENLSLGRPVIISDQTPWKDLEAKGAGLVRPLRDPDWKAALHDVLSWSQVQFDDHCNRARKYYEGAFDFGRIRDQYLSLFDTSRAQPREIVLVYDYFYPDYSAGGPIASLGNLARALKKDFPLRIITSAYHFDNLRLIEGIQANAWSKWEGVPVFYASRARAVLQCIWKFHPAQSMLYLNGIFSIRYFLLPLILSQWKGIPVIISPRGMLQEGALQRGWLKKILYLWTLRLFGLFSDVVWHATDQQEQNDVREKIDRGARIYTINNVPVELSSVRVMNAKVPGKLRLVYFSIISAKKNLHFLLEALDHPALAGVELDIVGPVKDQSYWRKCLKRISQLNNPARVAYKGTVDPNSAMKLLAQYHALVLPTFGENFGHAIVEMMALSRPVIISDRTPWKDLTPFQGGYSLPLERAAWVEALGQIKDWNNNSYQQACVGAVDYYRRKFDIKQIAEQYKIMLSSIS